MGAAGIQEVLPSGVGGYRAFCPPKNKLGFRIIIAKENTSRWENTTTGRRDAFHPMKRSP